jgi:hypothetical protein
MREIADTKFCVPNFSSAPGISKSHPDSNKTNKILNINIMWLMVCVLQKWESVCDITWAGMA